MPKYTIGLDFGTLSGRALLVNVENGEELASVAYDYPHGVMDESLPDGTPLGPDWALQHPTDYLEVLRETIPAVLKKSGVTSEDIIGLGLDFTTCSLMPVKRDGTPMCFLPQYQKNPNAYVKLWKHHAAQDKANRLNQIAQERGEEFLSRYGGKISSEWAIPKIWQVLDEDEALYQDIDLFVEAADWVTWQLTGTFCRNSCMAGYKAIWHKQKGFPSPSFFKALDPRLENVIEEKLSGPILPLGERAGYLSAMAAQFIGLREGIAVSVAVSDAHVACASVKINRPGKMLAIIGTSTCHMLLSDVEKQVPGMCGVVEDGIMPGYFGYEAGQSCVGDHFAWFVNNCLPASYYQAAEESGMSIHAYLRSKAEQLRPGESGLVALDWWNGNRSVLVDVDLTGMIVGMTLTTKPEEIYRALIEATAYGTRKIIQSFRESGLEVGEFYASGGIASKDPMMMQIYADVIQMPIHISGSSQGPALGSAIFAAAAAGKETGGYDSIAEASDHMGKLKDLIYRPNSHNAKVYDKLYAEYERLHDYFGRGENDVMKRLKEIKKSVK